VRSHPLRRHRESLRPRFTPVSIPAPHPARKLSRPASYSVEVTTVFPPVLQRITRGAAPFRGIEVATGPPREVRPGAPCRGRCRACRRGEGSQDDAEETSRPGVGAPDRGMGDRRTRADRAGYPVGRLDHDHERAGPLGHHDRVGQGVRGPPRDADLRRGYRPLRPSLGLHAPPRQVLLQHLSDQPRPGSQGPRHLHPHRSSSSSAASGCRIESTPTRSSSRASSTTTPWSRPVGRPVSATYASARSTSSSTTIGASPSAWRSGPT
jgi:hypothetical protein